MQPTPHLLLADMQHLAATEMIEAAAAHNRSAMVHILEDWGMWAGTI
jgi:hypothetical protein